MTTLPERRTADGKTLFTFDEKKLQPFGPLERSVIRAHYESILPNLIKRIHKDYGIAPGQPEETIDAVAKQEIERMAELIQEVTLDFFRIQRESLYDPKTHLLNTSSFELRFKIERELQEKKKEQAVREGRELKEDKKNSAVLFFDLDEFKRLNEVYGHILVDELLTKIGDKFNKELRTYDAACRFGGDELVLLLNNVSPEKLAGAATRAFKILNSVCIIEKKERGQTTFAVADGWDEEGKPPLSVVERVSASAGAYAYSPLEETNLAELLSLADRATTASKKSGRSGYTIIKTKRGDGTADGTFVQFDPNDSNGKKGPVQTKEVKISQNNERAITRESKKAEIVEALNRSLACARGDGGGQLPQHIQDTINVLADQVFVQCI